MSLQRNDLQDGIGRFGPTIVAVGYGETVRRLRGLAGLTQTELAAKAHVSLDTIVRVEANENITTYKLHQIATALETDITEFFCPGDVPAPGVWARLSADQRAYLEKLAHGMLGEQVPREDDE